MLARTTLRPDESSAAAARRFVADVLINRGFPTASIEQAVLVTSEVVTNAVLYATSDIEVQVRADPSMARVEVRDDHTGGEGLAGGKNDAAAWRQRIVEAFADGWGIDSHGPGTCIWFEVRP